MHFKLYTAAHQCSPHWKMPPPLTSNNQWKCKKSSHHLFKTEYLSFWFFPITDSCSSNSQLSFWYRYSKRKCGHFTIMDTFVVVGWLPAFRLPLLPSNAGNTGVWLLRFLLQTEKRTVHIFPVLSVEQTPVEFICVLKVSIEGCITLCNTCWYGHSFITYSNRPSLVFLLPDSKSSWDVPSRSCEFLDHFLSNDYGSSSQLDQTLCYCSNSYPV